MSAILYLTPAQQTALNGFFDLSVHVESTSPITGLDFTLATSNATLLSRDTAGSSFPDTISTAVDGDLGASTNDVAQALPAGDYLVAKLSFRVEGLKDPVITPQTYAGTVGWVGAAPAFVEQPFDQFVGATVMVPEPSLCLVTLVICLLWAWLTRRGAKKDKAHANFPNYPEEGQH
jgi:hypothetical protein